MAKIGQHETPSLYHTLDSWSYSTRTIKIYSVLVFAAALFTTGMSTWRGVDKHSTMHHQMHFSMTGVDVASYMTMDWEMSPSYDRRYPASRLQPIHTDLCSEEQTCDTAPWQSRAPCVFLGPDKNSADSKSGLAELAVPAEIQDQEPYIYANKRTKFRHFSPHDTCTMEKFGGYSVWKNNEMSWSIASTHNVFILIAGAFGVVAIITLSTFVHALQWTNYGQDPEQWHSYNRLIVAAFVFLYVTGTYWYASSASSDV